jgi:hypothetical protein
MTNRVVAQARHAGNQFLGSLKGLQIRARCKICVITVPHDGNRFLGYINLERRLGMDSQHAGPVQRPYLSYLPARLNSLPESILLLLKRLHAGSELKFLNSLSGLGTEEE